MRFKNRYFLPWFLCFVLLQSVQVCRAAESVSPLLLSFDIELDTDIASLEALKLQEFSTFFVTKDFALKFPVPVKSLANQGTVGVYSKAYSKLTKDGLAAAKKELQESIRAIETAAGQPPIWFRVPPLEVNRELLFLARELGFKYDSSESERWSHQDVLSEFPISINSTGRILFSDYDIFVTYGLDDQMALDLLKENYLNRKNSGRPFVFLLHPSIISQHAEVLHDFIKYVKQQGGACLSFDQYLAKTEQNGSQQIGIHLDPGWPELDVKRVTRDLLEFGVTDAYISTRDRDGNPYIEKKTDIVDSVLKNLRAAGIKIHFTLPVLLNGKMAVNQPELAMADQNGKPSQEYLTPSHPQVLQLLRKEIEQLSRRYEFDGIHLDHIAYPGLEYDYSTTAIKAFEKDNNVTVQRGNTAEVLLGTEYRLWTSWRSLQLKQLLAGVAEAVSRLDNNVQLSATLPGEAMTDFKEMEKTGADYRLLGEFVDVVVTRPHLNEFLITSFSLSHIVTMGRSAVGSKSIVMDIPYSEKNDWTGYALSNLVNELESKIKSGMGGIIYPPYNYLVSSPGFSGKEFENIFTITDAFLKVYREPVKVKQVVKPVVSAQTPVTSPDVEKVVKQERLFEMKEDVALVGGNEIKLIPLIISLSVTLLLLIVLAYFLFYKRIFARKRTTNMETTTIIDWQSMDKSILDEQISGKLAQSVSELLRNYDPVSTARYRLALIIDLVKNSAVTLSADELSSLGIEIPGWEVFCRSYVNEALMNGYLMENNSKLQLTEKGAGELGRMMANGFNSGQWIFVEQRMQELLLVTCPKCGHENRGQWYRDSFTCAACSAGITFKECDSIERKSSIET